MGIVSAPGLPGGKPKVGAVRPPGPGPGLEAQGTAPVSTRQQPWRRPSTVRGPYTSHHQCLWTGTCKWALDSSLVSGLSAQGCLPYLSHSKRLQDTSLNAGRRGSGGPKTGFWLFTCFSFLLYSLLPVSVSSFVQMLQGWHSGVSSPYGIERYPCCISTCIFCFPLPLVGEILACKVGVRDFGVFQITRMRIPGLFQITEGCVYLWALFSGILDKVRHGYLQFSPGGSDSGGPEILALKFSATESNRK